MATKEFNWFVGADMRKYRGEYVIISDNSVVSHGEDLTKMLNEFRKNNPGVIPKIAKIPKEETLILISRC